MSLEAFDLTWTPKLKVKMQLADEEPGVFYVYQEIADSFENLDTLIIAQETGVLLSLPGYAQNAINQLKTEGYLLSGEAAKKLTLRSNGRSSSALLKKYRLWNNERSLEVAQVFILEEDRIRILSYMSDEPSHIKNFISQLSSLTF